MRLPFISQGLFNVPFAALVPDEAFRELVQSLGKCGFASAGWRQTARRRP